MAVATQARCSPSSTPTVAPLFFFFFSQRELSLSDFKQQSLAAMVNLAFNLKLSLPFGFL
jgi:hypothetical protein